MDEFDIEKYRKFLPQNPDFDNTEHWARAKKLTFTLFNVLIDQDLTELVFVMQHFPSYIPLVCDHFRYAYGYSEKEADIQAASTLIKLGEPYHTNQFIRNVLSKLPKPDGGDLDHAKRLLERIELLSGELHPIILGYYAASFKRWLDESTLHPLQKIVFSKRTQVWSSEEILDFSSFDRDKRLNIPYLA